MAGSSAMAREGSRNALTFLCLLFILYTVASGSTTLSLPVSEAQVTQVATTRKPLLSQQELNKEDLWTATSSRRTMIGSRAPVCTYNECRGCRFKCTSEQVPVDVNDPANSAYHYRCVCHG